MEREGQAGAITVLVPVVVGLLVIMAAALLDVAAVYSARIRAQTAADAAALAAAPATFTLETTPREAARRMAQANGARLVLCNCRVDRRPDPRVVSVRTEVVTRLWWWKDIRVPAEAWAEFTPHPGER